MDRYTWQNALRGIIVTLTCVYMVLPTIMVIPISFTDTEFIVFPPQGFTLRWYETFFVSSVWRDATINSLVVGVFTMLFATVLGTMVAVALRSFGPNEAKVVSRVILLPMIVPLVVLAVAFYSVFSVTGIGGTRLSLVLAHTLYALPFVVISVSAVVQKVDWKIADAARSLGCGRLLAFRKVVVPVLMPGIISGAVFAFLTSFEEVVIALFLTRAGTVTLPVQMWSGIRFEISPVVAAASCIMLAASLLALILVRIVSRLFK